MCDNIKNGCCGATAGSCIAGGVTYPLLGVASVVALVGGAMFLHFSSKVPIVDAKVAYWGRWTAISGVVAGSIGVVALVASGVCCGCGCFAGATDCYDC